MRRDELPGGCELCAGQLCAGNFSGFLPRQFDGNARVPEPSGTGKPQRAHNGPLPSAPYAKRLSGVLRGKVPIQINRLSSTLKQLRRCLRRALGRVSLDGTKLKANASKHKPVRKPARRQECRPHMAFDRSSGINSLWQKSQNTALYVRGSVD